MGYFKDTLAGTGWMGGLRLATRGLGLVKIAVLARVLSPDDFGVFGIAALTLAFVETFTQTGVSLALVQQEEEIDKYVNTAWVMSIIRGLLIGAVILIFARPVTIFFHEGSVKSLLLIIAAVPLVRGFINPATVNFVKKLQFQKEFLLRGISLLADGLTAIILAISLKSPSALIYGMLVAAFVEVILSFLMSELRPRPLIVAAQAKKLLTYGKWVTLGEILSYGVEQLDDILVGRLLGTGSLGLYQMAYKFSVLPSSEITETISKVTFPVFAKIAKEKERLKQALLKTTATITALSLPLTLILIVYPKQIIGLLLSQQWLAVAQPLQILAIYGFILAISQAPSAALYALGRPDIPAKLRALRLVTLVVLIFPLVKTYGTNGAALAVVINAAVAMPFLVLAVRKSLS